MHLNIPLILACTTLCLAIPFSNTAPTAKFVANQVITLRGETLSLSVSDRQSGLNFSPCTSNANCVDDRLCLAVVNSAFQVCSPSQTCVCLPPDPSRILCSSESQCDDGESCVTVRGQTQTFCIDDDMIPILSDDSPVTGAPTTTTTTGFSSVPTEATTPTTSTGSSSVPTEVPTTTTTTDSSFVPTEAPTTTTTTDSSFGPTEATTTTTTSSSPGSTVPAPQLGLTFDPCQNSEGCAGSRVCLSLSNGRPCSGGDCRCARIPPVPCDDDSGCTDEGEGCFTISEILDVPFLPDELKSIKTCVSRAATDAGVCIGVHSLGRFSRKELVFKKHAVAHVLCDLNDSCATPGHMVQYEGKSMMMKSYCELTSCERKVMFVNSPKYTRGLTVPSRTKDLVFTALAARFESRVEERLLSVAVRYGF